MIKNITIKLLSLFLTLSIVLTISSLRQTTLPITSKPYYNLLPNEYEYLIENNISYKNVEPYLKYSSFNIYDYFHYEHIKNKYNYSYLEAVNYIKYPNYYEEYIYPNSALFNDSSLVLVNKSFYLTKDYIPSSLKKISDYNIKYIYRENEEMKACAEALDNYLDLYNAALNNNIELVIFSAYRSYDKQMDLYYNINKENDLYSARPGFSEHQAGYSLDISDTTHGLTQNLTYSKTYEWLKNNSYKYGFIIRYPMYKEKYTKYNFEPWHYRYVGVKHAEIMYKENLTLEEYLLKYFEL